MWEKLDRGSVSLPAFEPRVSRNLTPEIREFIEACVSANPAMQLTELRDLLAEEKGVHVSVSTVCKWLAACGIVRSAADGGMGRADMMKVFDYCRYVDILTRVLGFHPMELLFLGEVEIDS